MWLLPGYIRIYLVLMRGVTTSACHMPCQYDVDVNMDMDVNMNVNMDMDMNVFMNTKTY